MIDSAGFPEMLILVIAAMAALLILFVGIKIGMWAGRISSERDIRGRIKGERLDAVKRSRAVLGGQFMEQLAPFFPDFPGDPTELRFIGKPVDYISFRGASQGIVEEVVFIEVKTGGSRLTPVEQSLKKAVLDGRVRYEEYRIPAQTSE